MSQSIQNLQVSSYVLMYLRAITTYKPVCTHVSQSSQNLQVRIDHSLYLWGDVTQGNAQYNNICISKSPTFSLRTQILPLAAIRLAAHQVYSSTNQAENASGAAMRMEKPYSRTPQLHTYNRRCDGFGSCRHR